MWQEIVLKEEFPTVSDFARRVGVDPSYFCRGYKEWASKVRQRRDTVRGSRRMSPAAVARGNTRSLAEAATQLHQVRQELLRLQSKHAATCKELVQLRVHAEELKRLRLEQERHLGLFAELIDYLRMGGLSESKIAVVWEAMNRGIKSVGG